MPPRISGTFVAVATVVFEQALTITNFLPAGFTCNECTLYADKFPREPDITTSRCRVPRDMYN